MKLVMPFWATDPIAALLAGGMSLYHARVWSNRVSVAVAKSPAIEFSQETELGVTTGRSGSPGSYVVKVILSDCLLRNLRCNLVLFN